MRLVGRAEFSDLRGLFWWYRNDRRRVRRWRRLIVLERRRLELQGVSRRVLVAVVWCLRKRHCGCSCLKGCA